MLTAGTTLGPYKIAGLIGAGGMGEVYRAHDIRLARDVAIKVLPETLATDPEGRRRFAQEARATAALAHPNVLVIYDVGEHGGAPYLAMELLEGETLRKRLAAGPLPADKAAEIATQIARGLAAASDKGIIHRDLKPENLFLTRDGVVKILDFGLARLTHAKPSATDTSLASTATDVLTGTGQILGTMGYLSPEQVRGEPADARSDVFAFGCVLYEMLSGHRAFMGASAAETLSSILRDQPSPIVSTDTLLPAVERIARRCLAKRPEERYQTAREIGADLEGIASGAVGTVRVRSAGTKRVQVRAVLLGSALLVLALGGVAVRQRWGPFSRWPRGSIAPAHGKSWILVAEFEGPPGDSTLAPATRSLVSAALDQSEIVATVSQDQIQQALEAAGKPKDTRVDAALAKELASRTAVRAVLEGSIGRIGSGYSIVLRVVDADNAKVLLTTSGTAKDEGVLIPALGDLAKQLRKGLGENQHALQATRSMALVATPSFEAYKLYVEAGDTYSKGVGNRAAIRLYHAALALDPDFASAWVGMVPLYMNLGDADSVRVCADAALRRPERLTPAQESRLDILCARNEGDIGGALAACDRILMEDPEDIWALVNSNDLLVALGRFEAAFERTRMAMRLAPFGPSEVMKVNDTGNLIMLGRFDEAREANRHQKGIWRNWQRAVLELAASQPAAAESIALANLDDTGMSSDFPGGFIHILFPAQFARGAVAAAHETLVRAEEMSSAASDSIVVDDLRRFRIWFSVLSGGTMPMPLDVWTRDTTTATLLGGRILLTRGLWAAITGDELLARRCLEGTRGRPRKELVPHGAAPVLLEGRLETMAGRPEEAVRLLRPHCGAVDKTWGSTAGVRITWVRWFLADAFEQLDQPDSAAVYLERILAPPFTGYLSEEKPWAHRRLALLYARLGRIPDAERHLVAAERSFDRPDPAVQEMLEEVRVALAEAKGRSEH